MEKKKLKLSISGASKKTINSIEQAKSQSKNTVLIEKKSSRFGGKPNFARGAKSKENKTQSIFIPKNLNIFKSFMINQTTVPKIYITSSLTSGLVNRNLIGM